MTEEQIKQNAEEYADCDDSGVMHRAIRRVAFIAGAHSLDEEIEELNGQVALHKDRADYYHDLYMKLRNPWISVEERLPEEHQDVLIENWNGLVIRNDYISIGDINYMKDNPELFPRWMPTPKPELKKGVSYEQTKE